ncbi:hypothetical protein CB473P2_00109 [Enterocloster phage CB473P2]|jgi:hypothetical protein|nr:hypothetical protein CB457P2_00109 [Enterocloster phage CB457P2]WAX11396.1 hypothetical protein CB473P1_00109 [Enterocloster phage CB473P1]WAX11529.1 hypothetical protein CB473P2_00109 [Enterocloster phage CB473P2]
MDKAQRKTYKNYVYVLYGYTNETDTTIRGVYSSLKKADKAGEELRKATNNHTQSFIDRWIVK